MAGIGFVLRKLYRQDNLTGLVGACLHSAFASTGPWLFTVLALAAITLLAGKGYADQKQLFDFRTIVIYNFSFSLVLAGPIYMVATRFLADSIHRRDVSSAPGMLVGTLVLLWGSGLVIAVPFYFLYAGLTGSLGVSAVIHFLLVSGIWMVSIFISALRDYQRISLAFLAGMLTAVACCFGLSEAYGTVGLLNGFSIGLAVIMTILIANILMEYPYPFSRPFAFLSYFRKYWEIALCGLVYNMAIWIDKWIMWFSPEAMQLENGLLIYPHYDSAMFLAYLTTVPAMALFLFSTETHFFEHYRRFYRDIHQKASYARIDKNHKEINYSIFGNVGHFFLLQGSIATVGMLMAPKIIALLNGDYLQIGMLRFGMLGSLFQVLTLFLLVLLSYFDSRRNLLLIQTVFLLTNGIFTWVSMQAGFPYYGYGYFLSCFFTFILAAVIVKRYVGQLPYHTFITTNASLRT